jgi:hypothetical protein
MSIVAKANEEILKTSIGGEKKEERKHGDEL